jgi:hypothetical protein
MLAKVALADKRGRNPLQGSPLSGPVEGWDAFVAKATQIGVLDKAEKPVLQGKDLLDVVAPGKQLGELLKMAYKIQIDETIVDKEELKRRVLQLADKTLNF